MLFFSLVSDILVDNPGTSHCIQEWFFTGDNVSLWLHIALMCAAMKVTFLSKKSSQITVLREHNIYSSQKNTAKSMRHLNLHVFFLCMGYLTTQSKLCYTDIIVSPLFSIFPSLPVSSGVSSPAAGLCSSYLSSRPSAGIPSCSGDHHCHCAAARDDQHRLSRLSGCSSWWG